jgi:desulfoferrodoxin (superoxide reductase-like protein)
MTKISKGRFGQPLQIRKCESRKTVVRIFLLHRKNIVTLRRNFQTINIMAIISMFYGIIVYLYFDDNKRHHLPHIHVKYQGEEVVLSIPDGEILQGSIQPNKMKLVQAWIEIHSDELMANWELATTGQAIFKIDPLK